MMTPCTCLVQEGQISSEQKAALHTRMAAFSTKQFGSPPDIAWIEVSKGNGFTAAQPSNSVLVMMGSDRALSRSDREPMLRELGDIWMDVSGLGANEVVTVIRDPETGKDT